MFEVTFSDQSMAEMNRLPIEDQLMLVERISNLTPDDLAQPQEPLGQFSRNGKTYYRLRAGEFRCYFEVDGSSAFAHYILHRNTLSDFVFRTKLPMTDELAVEQQTSFWKYLESLRK